MTHDRYDRRQVRSCKTCLHYDAPPLPPLFASDCKTRLASWYPDRGYSPCPHWAEKPLTDEDYE